MDNHLSDRRKPSATLVALLITLVLQFGALVWGAATISASVTTLQDTARGTNAVLVTVTDKLARLDTRVTVLEDRARRNP